MNKEGVIYINEEIYPELLRGIKNPPEKLWYRGDLELLKYRKVAVVGSRKHTAYGRHVASGFGERLARWGFVVVSGLAIGIDCISQRACLDAGGKTIAVLGCGINIDYPASNSILRKDIEEAGLVLSEFEPDLPGSKITFPKRNRIISGLSEATVVCEAGRESGSLITADHALTQGRQVYAVPGNINSEHSLGSNELIRDGAIPITNMEELGMYLLSYPSNEKLLNPVAGFATSEDFLSTLGEEELEVYMALRNCGQMSINMLAGQVGMTVAKTKGIVSVLEIKGLLATYMGKIILAK